MPTTEEANRLDDLIAEVMSRGNIANPELMTSVRLSIARMEEKLDANLAKQADIDMFRNDVRKELHLVDKRITSLEGWRTTLLWATGLGWGLVLALASAFFYPLVARLLGA